MPRPIKLRDEDARRGKPLTTREQRVMELMSIGKTFAEIGQEFGFRNSAVDKYVASVRAKLGAVSTFQAMYLWTINQPRAYRLARHLHGDCE